MSKGNSILARIGADIEPLVKDLKRAEWQIKRQAKKMQETATMLSTRVSLPILGIGAAAVKSSADFERYSKGLESIMGDATKAAKELTLLREVAQNPGLSFEQAVKGSVRLQAVGFSADESRRMLAGFANALALVGGTAEDLDGVNLALSQIVSKGKVQAEEINQIAERVPQIRKAMQDAFGTADTEVIQKMGLSAKDFVNRVVVEMEKLPKAADTLSNSFDNVRQSIWFAMVSVGDSINTAFDVQGKVKQFTAWVDRIVDSFNAMDIEVKKTILTIAGIAAAIGPVMFAVSQLKLLWGGVISSVLSVIKLLNPTTLIIAAIGAAVYTVYKNWDLVKVQLASVYNQFVDLYNSSYLFRGVIHGVEMAFANTWTLVKGIAEQLLSAGKFAGVMINGLMTGNSSLITASVTAGIKEASRIAGETGAELAQNLSKGINDTLGQTQLNYITPEDIQAGIDRVTGKFKSWIFGEAKDGMSEGVVAGAIQSIEDLGNLPVAQMTDAQKKKFIKSRQSDTAVIKDIDYSAKSTGEGTGKEVLQNMFGDGIGSAMWDDALAAFDRFKEKTLSSMPQVVEANRQLRESMQDISKQSEQMGALVGNAFVGMAEKIGESMMGLGDGTQKLGQIMIRAAGDIAKSIMMISVGEMIKAAVSNGAGIGGVFSILPQLAGIGVAMGLISGLMSKATKSAPKLSDGGLAFGNTLATIGDNFNARIDPEVVAPLSKLKDFMRPAQMPVAQTQRIEIEGDKLVILLENINRKMIAQRGFGINVG